MDMELHSNFDPNGSDSIFDVHRRMAEIYTPYSMPVPEDRFLCGFSHIFAGGYSAGYYSYKWAEVMSADAFGAFEDVGLDNEEGVREVGRRFRDTVVSKSELYDTCSLFVSLLLTDFVRLLSAEPGRWCGTDGSVQTISWSRTQS
jgi:oligopeptidase A